MVDQLSERDIQHMGFISAAKAESAANIAAARFGPGVYLADPVRTAPQQWAVYTDTWNYVGSVFARTKKEALARAAQEHRVENPQVDKLEIGLKVYSIFKVRDEALPKAVIPPLGGIPTGQPPTPTLPPTPPPPEPEEPPEEPEEPCFDFKSLSIQQKINMAKKAEEAGQTVDEYIRATTGKEICS